MLWPPFGVMVNIWFDPLVSNTAPAGLIDPPAPTDAVIVVAAVRLKLRPATGAPATVTV